MTTGGISRSGWSVFCEHGAKPLVIGGNPVPTGSKAMGKSIQLQPLNFYTCLLGCIGIGQKLVVEGVTGAIAVEGGRQVAGTQQFHIGGATLRRP